MRRIQILLLLSFVAWRTPLAGAQPATLPSTQPATRPAVLQLLIPAGAAATLDDQMVDASQPFTVTDIAPGQTRRVAVKVKFAGGAEEQRLIDLEEGQTISAPVPTPQPDKAVAVPMDKADPVLALALSPDGRLLAIGLESNAIVIWDLKAGRPTRTLLRHRGPVQSLAFRSDGKQLLSGSGDNVAILWDLTTGNPLQTFSGHTNQIMSVAFSPDGRRVLTGSMDKSAIVWDAATAEKRFTLTGHTDQVFGIAWSPNGKTIATASLDKTGALWDAETGNRLLILRGHPDGVSCATFSPDGATVVTGSFDNSAIFWDVRTGSKLRQTGKHEIDIYGVTYSPDGRKLLTAARDEVVKMWDAASGRNLRTFQGHNSDVGGAVVTADGRMMFSCSRDGMVKLWDMATGMELASLITDSSRTSWAVVAPDGLFDASGAGRHMMGFRFAKMAGGSLDQFFNERFHPGLLSGLTRGERPYATLPLGHSAPPIVKIISPKNRTTTPAASVSIDLEVTDQGGGISELRLFNRMTPIASRNISPAKLGAPARFTFDNIVLAPGANPIRVIATNADRSWESASSEIELTRTGVQPAKGRMYLLEIGDLNEIATVIEKQLATSYDRIDRVKLTGDQARVSNIENALADLAELTRPQDAIVVIIRGVGAIRGEQLELHLRSEPVAGETLLLHQIATQIGTAAALQRGLLADLRSASAIDDTSSSTLRGIVERFSRTQGIAPFVALAGHDVAASALSDALSESSSQSKDIEHWFHAASEKFSDRSR